MRSRRLPLPVSLECEGGARRALIRSDDPQAAGRNNIMEATADRDFSSFPTFSLFTALVGAPGPLVDGTSKGLDIFELVAHAPALLKVIESGTISGR